ncbi:MAG TPA: discoidin domain-containing protein [Methylomirabilota bacterium]
MSAAGPAVGGAAPRPARDWWLCALLALLGFLLTLYLAFPRLDADQAITGLMGVSILRGEFPIFFWMQDHAGVPESYTAAPLFFLFGISRRVLDLVPALGTLALAWAVYRTGVVLFGRGAGLLGILFITVVSAYMAANYTLARSYYIEHLLVGQLVLLGAALWLARPLSEPARCRVAIAMGLAGGLGLYFNFQIVDALVPALAGLLLTEPGLPFRRAGWLGVGAFLLGSLPFWAYNLSHDWATVATGARFQGHFSGSETARILARDLLPVVLGVRSGSDQPAHLPGPLAWTIPAVVGGVVLLLLARVAVGIGRLRRDTGLAGEALLLIGVAVTLGVVWYGGYIRVPRYLLPLIPLVALMLARAAQLSWRRTRVGTIVWVTAYLLAVGLDLAPDLTALRADARVRYRQEREADGRLFAALRAMDLRKTYAFDYWLAPRLTFEAREEIIVAQPFNDRYPPYTRAVDRSTRPGYVVQAGVETFRAWMEAMRITAREDAVGEYRIFHDFTAPPELRPLARSGFTVQASPGRGDPASILDDQIDTGWSRGAGGPAWIEVDLGAPRLVSAVTLVNDRAERVPDELAILAEGAGAELRPVAALASQGVAARWENNAIRIAPSRTLTVRFDPVVTRRVRLVEKGPPGRWSVAELFLLGPVPPGSPPDATAALVQEGRQLESAGRMGEALRRYHEAMRRSPDDPAGYDAFARLTTQLRASIRSPLEYAARLADLGLLSDARGAYADAVRALGPECVHVELWRLRARLAAADGDAREAARLSAEADAALAPSRPVGAVMGGQAELVGYDILPQPLRAGEIVEVTTHWRLSRAPWGRVMVWVHLRADDRPDNQGTRFGDDYPLFGFLPELGAEPQHMSIRRRIMVPAGATAGRYRLVAGLWNPGSGWRLHRWWRGILPTLDTTLELGRVEVVRSGS